ncbi:MAG: DUF4366 domain-containing protein [Lachnospiraceae bacterium]|nr:DUF4366 domain-containing protein [Lachnospiraceae bacterium]
MSCKGCCKKDIKSKIGIDLDQIKEFGGSQAARVAELAAAAGLGNFMAKAADEEEDEKKSHIGLVILSIVGIIAIGCIVGYLVYRHFSPDYLEDFDDEFEDDEFEDEDFFADEADS